MFGGLLPGRAGDATEARPSALFLSRRRVYILPTRHGTAFAAMLLVLLLGSANYNNSLGYVLTFLLASLALISLLHTERNLTGLSVRPGRVQPVFAGAPARFGLCLDNRGAPRRHALMVSYQRAGASGSGSRSGAATEREGRAVLETAVPADALLTVELPVSTERRGWVHLGRVTLASRYPLGLFRAWSHVELDARCLVYPAPGGARELPPSAAEPAPDGGVRGAGREDFSGFREYRPGDSPRQIHWKAVAREQGIPIKLFAGASAGELRLRWSEAPGPDLEARLSQLCRWVLSAEERGHRYALELPDALIPPDHGDAHLHCCLRALALFRPGGEVGGRG